MELSAHTARGAKNRTEKQYLRMKRFILDKFKFLSFLFFYYTFLAVRDAWSQKWVKVLTYRTQVLSNAAQYEEE